MSGLLGDESVLEGEGGAPPARFGSAPRSRIWFCFLVLFCAAWMFELKEPGYYCRDDNQMEYIPQYLDSARAWREGSFPLLTRSGMQGFNLAAEYQTAPFHPVHTCVLLLADFLCGHNPAKLAAALASFYLASAGTAAFCLGLNRRWPLALAASFALSVAFQGWLARWGSMNWLPAACGISWVYWLMYHLEVCRQRPSPARQWAVVATVAFLLAAGWPFACLMGGLVCAYQFLLSGRRWLTVRLFLLCAAGLAIAALPLLFLKAYTGYAFRFAGNGEWVWDMRTPLLGLFGLVNPFLFVDMTIPWAPGSWPCLDINLGLVGLAPIATALAVRGRRRSLLRPEMIFALVVLLLTLSPSLRPFQWAFRWQPLLLYLLSLTGHQMLATDPQENPAAILWKLILPVTLFGSPYGNGDTFVWGLATLALSLCWSEAWTRWPARRWEGCCLVTGLTILGPLLVNTALPFPTFYMGERVAQAAPLDPNRRYWTMMDFAAADPKVWAGESREGDRRKRPGHEFHLCRPGFFALYADLDFINGYSPCFPLCPLRPLECNHLGFSVADLNRLIPETMPNGLLDWLAVDGLVLDGHMQGKIPDPSYYGWKMVHVDQEGAVFHRPPMPHYRWAPKCLRSGDVDRGFIEARFKLKETGIPMILDLQGSSLQELGPPEVKEETLASVDVQQFHEGRLSVDFDVSVGKEAEKALLVLARPWTSGYVCTLNGEDVPVRLVNFGQIGLELPGGKSGHVHLRYWPPLIRKGLLLALGGLLLGAFVIHGWRVAGP